MNKVMFSYFPQIQKVEANEPQILKQFIIMQSKITCKSRKEERGYCVKPLHYILKCIAHDNITKLSKCSLSQIPTEFHQEQIECDLNFWIDIPHFDLVLHCVENHHLYWIAVANIFTLAFKLGSFSCFCYLLQR
jgi:hypothetical protein